MNREYMKPLPPPVHLHTLAPSGDEPPDQKPHELNPVPVILHTDDRGYQ